VDLLFVRLFDELDFLLQLRDLPVLGLDDLVQAVDSLFLDQGGFLIGFRLSHEILF
jgi:hypothetical protein